jgi:hypothetical protein
MPPAVPEYIFDGKSLLDRIVEEGRMSEEVTRRYPPFKDTRQSRT